MPLFDYICSNPDCPVETFESFSSFNEAPLAKCACGQFTEKRLISGGTFVSIKGLQTLGSLADKNRKEMGQYLYDKKMREKEERAIMASNYVGQSNGTPRERKVGDKDYIPPWRSTKEIDKSLERLAPPVVAQESTKLDIKTTEEAHRYIMTGKKGQGSGPPTI